MNCNTKIKHSHLLLILFFAVPFYASCANRPDGNDDKTSASHKSLNWADTTFWYEGGRCLNAIDASRPDVFYLLPTCVFAWDDETGARQFNADPTKADHREAWQLSAELADTIFATGANLFLPYYRQATFDALEGEHATAADNVATNDALAAFDYYMEHFNHGRPFILAGYSQGGKMVTDILKHMDDSTFSQLIAAYVVGYGVTAQDTVTQDGHHTSHIKLAQDAVSCGVTINFNSVTSADAVCQLLCHDNIGCINPISWSTSATPAVLLDAGQEAQADDPRFPYGTAVVAKDSGTAVTVSVDPQQHILLVNGIDPQRYYLAALQNFFPVGNLHLQELFFYGDYLRDNVLLRSNSKKSSDGRIE